MAVLDFPLCVYCDNETRWDLTREEDTIIYLCGMCGNEIIIEYANG